MQQQPHTIDPAELAGVKDLQLLARIVVEGFLSGLHRSPHHGSSVEFAQYRPYTQGDDPRFVDWSLYARTDRLHIKQFHDETNLRCTVLLDCSGSMNYTSGGVAKFQYARMLAACLLMMLFYQKDAFGFIGYHHQVLTYVQPKNSPKHLRRVLLDLNGLQPEGTTDTAASLHYLGNIIKPRGMVILISDLLHPVDEMVDHLKSLRARRHDVLIFQISDPAEETFPFDRTITLVDSESTSEQYVIPDLVRKEYLENRRNHFAEIRKACHSAEIDIAEFSTAEPLNRALQHFIYHRNHALMTSGSLRGKSMAG